VKVLLACPMDGQAVESLSHCHDVHRLSTPGPAELQAAAADSAAVVLRSGVTRSEDVLTNAPALRLVVRAGAGVDNIDLDSARRHGVRVVRIPGMSAPAVAEFTFALLLSLARKVTLADRLVREGHWPKPELGGPLLHGRVMGVVGVGRIGSLVAGMARAWDMQVVGCVEHPTPAAQARLAQQGVELLPFPEVAARANFLSLHVPLTGATRHMVDASVLATVPPGALLVNVARGGVVDEAALHAALTKGLTNGGRLAGAALDVHETEGEGVVPALAALPNVVLTPHIGAMAEDAQRLIGRRVVELIDAFQEGRLDEELRDHENVV
jgi:D-3-phosphoglycerate dehydrogenase / 2-oxoglutarate reductase